MRVEVSVHPDVLLDEERLREVVRRKARLRGSDVRRLVVRRRAIDARRGTVRVHLVVEVGEIETVPPPLPIELGALRGPAEVAIVGAGPAGMFCAWELARRGIRSVVLERGKPVQPRRRDLALLTRHGALDPDSNYCFGEGGAGTFSDGKLYTRSSKRGDVQEVLRAFVGYGAAPEILVDARPHIGTNKLPAVVSEMRAHLESAGVTFAFESRVDAIVVRGGRAAGVRLADGATIDARAVVVAAGHSARDVLAFVRDAGAATSFKPFAVGVRVEHPQALIDRIQFGDLAGHPALGAASYRVVEGGGYSFCMCPGGFIAPAATEPQGQVVNGWSPSSRSGRYANSGFVVRVGVAELAEAGLDPDDAGSGIAYQRAVEQRAFKAGGGRYVAPAQRLDDFVAKRASHELPACSYPRGVAASDLDAVLGPLADRLRAALVAVDSRLPGFAGAQGIAVGIESRTSCPVRIERDADTGASPTLPGLYPCGEGAGQAGGIMSAALDALRVAASLSTGYY